MKWNLQLTSVALLLPMTATLSGYAAVRTGLDRVSEFRYVFSEKRIGIIANPSALDSQGRPVAQVVCS